LDLQERNEPLNDAAYQAAHVIFVSEFSRRSYYQLCGEPLKSESVALNWVDTDTFYPRFDFSNDGPQRWLAVATSWKRDEKRGHLLEYFRTAVMQFNHCITIVGNDVAECFGDDSEFLRNERLVKIVDYVESPEELADLMRHHDALVNLSYRDASPKVVAEAVSCGLPVLYANSGGVPEMVPYGVGIHDYNSCQVEDGADWISYLSGLQMKLAMHQFLERWQNLRRASLRSELPKQRMWNMLNHYYDVFRGLANGS